MAVTFLRPSAKSNYVMKLISPEAVGQKRDRGVASLTYCLTTVLPSSQSFSDVLCKIHLYR